MKTKTTADQKAVPAVTDPNLDFNCAVPLQKSYIIASSARSGSNFLAWRLWSTGVLGAPCEYLNPNFEMHTMMNRLKASSPADYLAKLLVCRTSPNGIFGLKSHFHNFAAFLEDYPGFLETLSPVSYIYISREDKIAQAVSMAKAYQTAAWTSKMEGVPSASRYDRALIAKCLEEIEQQETSWLTWFRAHNLEPFKVIYEVLTANTAAVVQDIVEFLNVYDDKPEELVVPAVDKQGDRTNADWIERFKQESEAKAKFEQPDNGKQKQFVHRASAKSAAKAPDESDVGDHFFDRYPSFLKEMPGGSGSATGFIEVIRTRHRYEAMVGKNRELFRNGRVLDIMSGDGLWSMAALDAGAAQVVAIESEPKRVAAAKKTLANYGVKPQSCQFITSEVFPAMRSLDPDAFDLVLCKGFLEVCDPRQFFNHVHRLRAKQVILDTSIVTGKGPISRYTLRLRDVSAPKATGRYATVMSIPNHELIAFFCDYYDFRWRLIDWQALGLTDWIGIHDYERDRRRTYVLERIS
jgi:LPS sulfotransferase NodH